MFSTAPQPFQFTTQQQQPTAASPFWSQAASAPVRTAPEAAPAAVLPPAATLNERFLAAAEERACSPKVVPHGRLWHTPSTRALIVPRGASASGCLIESPTAASVAAVLGTPTTFRKPLTIRPRRSKPDVPESQHTVS
jgi:hypothetical protein